MLPDVLYILFSGTNPVSYLNAVLLGIIALILRKKYHDILEKNREMTLRINRLERTFLSAGIKLCDIEEI